MNRNTLFFKVALCALFLVLPQVYGQSVRNMPRGNFLLASGSRESGTESGDNLQDAEKLSGERLIGGTRKHPHEISSCARGFLPPEPEKDDSNSAAVNEDREVFFFGDTGGFLSKHTAVKTSGGEQSFSIAMDSIWQISDLPVRLIAPHPDGNMVAVYESDGFSTHRISLWDWENKTRVYAKRFHDSVNSIDWSANGTFLMVGNTSFEGITVLEGDDGKMKEIFKSSPGIVSLSATGRSERSIITYTSSGKIVYTNVEDGETIGEYLTEPGLNHPALCNNNRYIIGFSGTEALTLDATTGELLFSCAAENPVPAVYSSDTVPVWFQKELETYSTSASWSLHNGDEPPEEIPVAAGTDITVASAGKDFRIFGTSGGDIYIYADKNLIREETEDITPITGICGFDDGFYFVAGGKLYYIEDYDNTPSVILDSGNGPLPEEIDAVTKAGDGLLLWSSRESAPVLFWNREDANLTGLYTTSENISSFSVTKHGVSFVEGNSTAVYIGNPGGGTGAKPFRYSSAGLQDAVMVSDSYMLVSKSAGMRSPSPLLLIDIKTGETVPVKYSGDLCFSLTMADEQRGYLYAFAVTETGGETKTELVFIKLNTENLQRTQIETVAVYPDEDLTAELLPVSADRILMNLGKSSISEIKRRTGTKTNFERGYALPSRIAAAGKKIVTLNQDGSLSWFSYTSKNIEGTTAVSISGEWLAND